ncbi:hypothetical protein KY290_013666 [Solanum tuberosum]|uniref:Non-LTR retroelement reverse transcriptase n=1 Tax=Solanum tuberosum TaxID=4113 RepID=A0ABQ7VN26_SOLTU|nr:hypothetical protein KY290_013666 [Solanum tuberosum]
MKVLEENNVMNNTKANRCELSRCRAEFTKYLKLQDTILRQKAGAKWLEEGDINTSYFHSTIKDRRRRLSIKKIMNEQNQWLEENDQIVEGAVSFYQNLFSCESVFIATETINYLPRCITDEDNEILSTLPTLQEVKEYVFSLDPDSAPRPDGLSGCFYQAAWNIISSDVHKVVISFFSGDILPKKIIHTCLVLIPKIDHPQSFSDLRPISLCNVSSKIVSKILNARLASILPRIISKNQTGFVKGRTILENIILAQEIISDINKPNRGGNMVIKLDMTKAYDRVSWSFMCLALRKMGFSENWIHIIYSFLSNNWYSVIINGGIYGFFKSSRGLRQGDPLSPSLFILSVELLSHLLTGLQTKIGYKGFYMSVNGPQIKHLTFADDTIIFCNGDKRYLKMNTVISYYNDIVKKVTSKIRGCHSKLLSPGGRAILIRHVLLTLPTHLLSVVVPPKGTFEIIEKCLARFFWSGQDTRNKHHWISWDNLCYPFEEGGVNFRRIEDICNSLKSKQWWKLRTSKYLWSDFMRAKYLNNQHPVKVQWKGGTSQYWKSLCGVKFNIEKIFIGGLEKGMCHFEGIWHWDTLQYQLSTEDKNRINGIGFHLENNKEDYHIWTDTSTGEFSTSSAWNNSRHKMGINIMAKNIWNKDIPFKMTFLTWRAIHDRLPTDERVTKNYGISIVPGWSLGIGHMHNTLKMILLSWWNLKTKNPIVAFISKALPPIICWEPWRTRVKWLKPPRNFIKLNSDGSCVQRSCGGGGLIRDNQGNMMFAYSLGLGQGTSNMAEARALLYGLKWCVSRGYDRVWGETDSLLLVKCINGEWRTPWRLDKLIQEAHQIVESHGFIISHCFREASKPADILASRSYSVDAIHEFNSFSDLSREVRGLINTNRWELPSF